MYIVYFMNIQQKFLLIIKKVKIFSLILGEFPSNTFHEEIFRIRKLTVNNLKKSRFVTNSSQLTRFASVMH